MLVRVDSDRVALQVAYMLQAQVVINLPERLIIVFEKAIFYHLRLILMLDMRHDFRSIGHA